MAANKMIKHLKNRLQNEDAFASLEAVSLFIVVTVLVAFTLGVFGILHTAILQSIASRNYAFETFRHRTNLTYFRDAAPTIADGIPLILYFGGSSGTDNYRIHAVVSDDDENDSSQMLVTARAISMGRLTPQKGNDSTTEHDKISAAANLAPGQRNGNGGNGAPVEVNPVWIKTQYGICLNASCGGS